MRPKPLGASLLTLCTFVLLISAVASRAETPPVASEASAVAGRFSVEVDLIIEGFSDAHRFADPTGLYYDAERDELYVADTGNGDVDVFDGGGFPKFQIRNRHMLAAPFDVLIREGYVYVSQMASATIARFNFRGDYVSGLRGSQSDASRPGSMALGPDGRLYVADRGTAQVLVFDAEDRLVRAFGGKDSGQGRFRLISGIAVANDGRIVVADAKLHSVQVFDAEGRRRDAFGGLNPDNDEFLFPSGVAVDDRGRIWVADAFRHQVRVLRPDWTPLFRFGVYGVERGRLFFPVDLAVDAPRRRVYVLEKGAKRVQVFRVNGGR